MSPRFIAAAVCCATLLISGCASNGIANSEQVARQAQEMANSATLTPAEALTLAIGQMAQAQAEQLGDFAPSHLEQAEVALKATQSLYDQKAPGTEVLTAAFKVGSLLDAGRRARETVERVLARSLEHKAILQQLDAPSLVPDDYAEALDDQMDLIRDIERGKVEQAQKDEASLLKLMTKVEVKTLKTRHLVPVEQLLDKAEADDADEYAEKTFAQAEATLAAAHAFIESNYRDREGVAQAGIKALHAATHAWNVGREARQWVGLNKPGAEAKVLYVESLLSRVNQGIGVENLHTLPLPEQSKLMAEKLERGEAKVGQAVVIYGQSQEEAAGLEVTPVTDDAQTRDR